MRRKAYIILGVVLVLLYGYYRAVDATQIRLTPPTPPTPPILKGARASGGWASEGCPPQYRFDDPAHEQIDPDVEARLEKAFPKGTSAASLQQALLAQGFKMIPPCPNDASIKRAQFTQKGTGFLVYTAYSVIAWKSDQQGKIVWTKPQLRYDGL